MANHSPKNLPCIVGLSGVVVANAIKDHYNFVVAQPLVIRKAKKKRKAIGSLSQVQHFVIKSFKPQYQWS